MEWAYFRETHPSSGLSVCIFAGGTETRESRLIFIAFLFFFSSLHGTETATDGKKTTEDWVEIQEILDQIDLQQNGYV